MATSFFQLFRRKPLLFSSHPTSDIQSANHISFSAALTSYLSHLYTLVWVTVVVFRDRAVASRHLLPASTLVPLLCNLRMAARVMLSEHEQYVSPLLKAHRLTQNAIQGLCSAQNLVSSDLTCYSHHSVCHTGVCLFFCSSHVPSTLQTQGLCIFKSLCWNVLLTVATWFVLSHFKSLLKCHLIRHRY